MLALEAASPEALEPILEGGRVPGVWTVNDPAEADALVAAGAATIITDRPRALLAPR
jgi:glycerophosphoryl diester phosphodiesterase